VIAASGRSRCQVGRAVRHFSGKAPKSPQMAAAAPFSVLVRAPDFSEQGFGAGRGRPVMRILICDRMIRDRESMGAGRYLAATRCGRVVESSRFLVRFSSSRN